jgi:hypothetical protein
VLPVNVGIGRTAAIGRLNMRCTCDYVHHPDHDYSHLPMRDVELLHQRGATAPEVYATSLLYDEEGKPKEVQLYKYVPLIGATLFERIQDNRIILEKGAP